MDVIRKRIIAILLIAVVGIGIGVGILSFYVFQEKPDYATPGAPSGVSSDHIIKIACIGDRGEFKGDANYEGTYLAVKTINKAGGIVINDTPCYFGVTSLDTKELAGAWSRSWLRLLGEKIRRLIEDKKVDFAIGGQLTEFVLGYREQFMEAKKLFLGTGVSTNILCEDVRDNYARYKYFIRCSPFNSTEFSIQMISTLANFILEINASYPNHEVKDIGILAEDLSWTEFAKGSLQTALSALLLEKEWNINFIAPIFYDIERDNATDMNTYLESLQSAGADIVIPLISDLTDESLLTQQYNINQYDYLLFGLDERAHFETFWEDSGESCAYETIMQLVYRTNKTELTIPVWDAYIAEFGHEPHYIAIGAYDAIYHLSAAIEAVQTLEATEIIAHWETWTRDNPRVGAAGKYAWWPKTHDLVAEYPYMYNLCTQWQPDGTKIVTPGFGNYNDSLATGAYKIAPWIDTAWL